MYAGDTQVDFFMSVVGCNNFCHGLLTVAQGTFHLKDGIAPIAHAALPHLNNKKMF
jgi:hypothetical protein